MRYLLSLGVVLLAFSVAWAGFPGPQGVGAGGGAASGFSADVDGARADAGSPFQALAAQTFTVLDFDTEVRDDDGFVDIVGDDTRITFPGAGLYLVTASFLYTGNSQGDRFCILRRRNSSDVLQDEFLVRTGPITNSYEHLVFGMFNASSGDYMEMVGWAEPALDYQFTRTSILRISDAGAGSSGVGVGGVEVEMTVAENVHTTYEVVEWDSETYDHGGHFDAVADDTRVTFNTAGRVIGLLQCNWQDSQSGEKHQKIVHYNSADVVQAPTIETRAESAGPVSSDDHGLQTYWVYDVEAGDYFEGQVFAATATIEQLESAKMVFWYVGAP